MIGSSDHDQVAERRGKKHVVAPSVVKRRTNPERKTRRKRDAADIAVRSSTLPPKRRPLRSQFADRKSTRLNSSHAQ